MIQWEPIETCPTDRRVLLRSSEMIAEGIKRIYFGPRGVSFEIKIGKDKNTKQTIWADMDPKPTHWAPINDPLTELTRCKICGGKATTYEDYYIYKVKCIKCSIIVCGAPINKDKIRDRWNCLMKKESTDE